MGKLVLGLALLVCANVYSMDLTKAKNKEVILPAVAGSRFLLTGAPGAGKTTLVNLLRDAGCQVTPEAFTKCFTEAQESGESMADFFADPLALRHRLYEAQCAVEESLDQQKTTFLDRGTPDICYFGERFGIAMPEAFRKTMLERKYDGVLMVDLGPEEFYERTEVRQETYAETQEVEKYFKTRLAECGYWVARVPFATPERRVERVFSVVNQAYLYSTVIDCFAGINHRYTIQPFFGPISLIEIESLEGAPYRFYGVHVDRQHEVDFAAFRDQVLSFSSTEVQNVIQVVGDSGPECFNEAGTAFGRKFLRAFFDQPVMIEYGFTGNRFETHQDINSFVNEYLEECPEQASRVIANILGHTVVALTQWGCSGSAQVRNFVVVYNEDGVVNMKKPVYDDEGRKLQGYTTFGDDVTMSDNLLSAEHGDTLICLEGGAQSFCQVVNTLRRGVPVHLVYNLRYPKINLFSAARFLHKIKQLLEHNSSTSKEDLRELNEKEITTYGATMFDETKGDYKTKKQLYAQAIKGLIEEGLYEKIPQLCIFHDAA